MWKHTQKILLLGLLVLGLEEKALASTNAISSLEALPDNNYIACDRPTKATFCFAFRKMGNRLVGVLYTPRKGDPRCIEGIARKNKVSGRVFEILYGWNSDPKEDKTLIGRLNRQRAPQEFQLGEPQILESRKTQPSYAGARPEYYALILYDNSTLEVNNYHIETKDFRSFSWLGQSIADRDIQKGCQNFIWR